MKTFVLTAALAALGIVSASPTQTLEEPPTKRASLPAVSASGNGKHALLQVRSASKHSMD